jgi:hypothetical protein
VIVIQQHLASCTSEFGENSLSVTLNTGQGLEL